MPRLIPQVGDIWLYDTTNLYGGRGYARYEHWLILKAGPANTVWEDMNPHYLISRDFAIYFLNLESGRYDAKIFYSRDWSGNLDLYGNPYYKKVA